MPADGGGSHPTPRKVCILEGGINGWIEMFDPEATPVAAEEDELRFIFEAALGDSWPAADPDPRMVEAEHMRKVELDIAVAPSGGGCG